MNWNELKSKVEANGNVLTVTMEALRDAAGADRLGVNIRADISKSLAGMGLGHIPQELPTYQHEHVRLYKQGTPVAELIATVLTPGQHNDAKLQKQFGEGGTDYAAIVDQIRELVAE